MPEQIPWYHQGPTSTSNPFSSLGTDWCPRCKMECEADMHAHHDPNTNTFAYKKWCCRCGTIISCGIYNQVCMMTQRPLPAVAFAWAFAPGKDRR